MNITPTTRTVTDYHLTLSQTDAQLALDDPQAFGRLIAERLRAHLTPTNGNKPPRKAKARPNGKGQGKIACPLCGLKIAQKYMGLHTRKRHPEATSASAA